MVVVKNVLLISFWLLLTAAAGAVVVTETSEKKQAKTQMIDDSVYDVDDDTIKRVERLNATSLRLAKEHERIVQRLKKLEGVKNE